MDQKLPSIFRDKTNRPKGTFYFSHSVALLPTLSLLGLFKDSDSLRHDNFEQMRYDREYRTSFIGSFSSSLALILFSCKDEPNERIMAIHQERPVQLDKCQNLLCGFDEFQNAYLVSFEVS